MPTYKAVVRSNELYHFNKNHSPKDGKFTYGDGDGDGVSDDHKNKKRGQYSAKIENYHRGNVFRKPYYIDKNGHKRSYMSYKEMPVEMQNSEMALQKGKDYVKKVGGTVGGVVTSVAITAGSAWLVSKILS